LSIGDPQDRQIVSSFGFSPHREQPDPSTATG